MGLTIVPLTAELASQLNGEAALALNGDGTCSLEAMRTSCFASELCGQGGSAMQLDQLLGAPHKWVALSDRGPDGEPLDRQAFVGCVSAGSHHHARSMFRLHEFEPDSLVLSNLCVHSKYRNRRELGDRNLHVGRKLVQKVLDLGAPKIYLMIARDPGGDASTVFASRVPMLQAVYSNLGFHECGECQRAFLLRHGA